MKNRLKVLRAERNWSQADLAQKLEVSRQSVNAVETGKLPAGSTGFGRLPAGGSSIAGLSAAIATVVMAQTEIEIFPRALRLVIAFTVHYIVGAGCIRVTLRAAATAHKDPFQFQNKGA